MSYKGQKYVAQRRVTTAFSFHPDTIQIVNKLMALQNKPKSQVVEMAIQYYQMKLYPKFPERNGSISGNTISPEEEEYFERLALIENGLYTPPKL